MAEFPRPLAVRRPLLFSALVTSGFIVALVAVVVAQKAVAQPLVQEAIGTLGRAVVGAAALVWLARLGWRRWLAGPGTGASGC
jgi:hypothetical protein